MAFVSNVTAVRTPSSATSTSERRRVAFRSRSGVASVYCVAEISQKTETPLDQPLHSVVLTHTTADFDTLASAVGLARLRGEGTVVVLPGGEHPSVKRFLALHTQLLPVVPFKAIDPARLGWVGVVDTHKKSRLGNAAEWPELAESCTVYDHHDTDQCDITNPRLEVVKDDVGATATMVIERLQAKKVELTPSDATLLALAIHFDTGSLTFENTTPRDVAALAWLMNLGADQRTINEFTHQMLSHEQQILLNQGLQQATKTKRKINGLVVADVFIETPGFVKGLSTVAQDVLDLSGSDLLIFAAHGKPKKGEVSLSVIGRARSRVDEIDIGECFSLHGGGGHPKAASLQIKLPPEEARKFVASVTDQLVLTIPLEAQAKDFMAKEVEFCDATTSITEAKALMLAKGVSGLVVTDENQKLRGVVTRFDVMTSELQNRSNTPVTAWITVPCKTLSETDSIDVAEALMAENKIGRLPVLDVNGTVVGIVTRTTVLKQRRLM